MNDASGFPGSPTTKDECLEQARRWGSTLSHNNMLMSLASSNAEAIPAIAIADAAEVARLSALYTMLPEKAPESAATPTSWDAGVVRSASAVADALRDEREGVLERFADDTAYIKALLANGDEIRRARNGAVIA